MSKRSKKSNRTQRRKDDRAEELDEAKIKRAIAASGLHGNNEVDRFLDLHPMFRDLEKLEFKPETPLEEAQLLAWQAFGEGSAKKRVQLAEQALQISADCADAFVILAEDKAVDWRDKITLYRQGVEAGKRAISDLLEEPTTAFGDDLRTRPFMRALQGLAECLYVNFESAQAIEIWQELLRLNPDDDERIRYKLVVALAKEERLPEAEALLERYADEKSPFVMFATALCYFKKYGSCPKSDEILEKAQTKHLESTGYMFKGLDGYVDPRSVAHQERAFLKELGDVWNEEDDAFNWFEETIAKRAQRMMAQRTFPTLNDSKRKNVSTNEIPPDPGLLGKRKH